MGLNAKPNVALNRNQFQIQK